MGIGVVFPLRDFLETIDVVTQFCSPQQAGVRHVIEIPERRRFVDPIFGELPSDFRVSERRGRFPQHP